MMFTGLLLALLNFWRPFFFLTDDNLTGWLPAVTEFHVRLWNFESPFTSRALYGGTLDIRTDPGFSSFLGPFALLFSWLSLTKYAYALVDVVSVCNTLAISSSFAWSALWLRRHLTLKVADWQIIVLAVSYTFTPYNLFVGSSWIGFLNPQVSLPLLLVGLLHPSAGRGVLLQMAAFLFAFFGGHAHPFLMLGVAGGIIATGASLYLRSWSPIVRLVLATAATSIVVLPLVIPSLDSFAASARSAGLLADEATIFRLPPTAFAFSFILGPLAAVAATHFSPFGASVIAHGLLSAAFSAANLLFLIALFRIARAKQSHNFGLVLIALLSVAGLLVVRPEWLASIVSELPFFRSLRWPFREAWMVTFSVHFFLLFAMHVVSSREFAFLIFGGTCLLTSNVLLPPPSMGPFEFDRRLLISGEVSRYWTMLDQQLGVSPGVVVGIDSTFVEIPNRFVPFSALGTHNFAAYFGEKYVMGYTIIPSVRGFSTSDPERAYHPGGFFTRSEARDFVSRHPNYWLIELTSVRPARWTIRTPTGVRAFWYDDAHNRIEPF